MDHKLRAELQTELAPCSMQVFMDTYAAAHPVYGELSCRAIRSVACEG
jgi:hypothetical protein